MICPNCRKEIADAQKFCPECGISFAVPANGLLQELSKKIQLEAFVWLGVAALQLIIGFYNLAIGFTLNATWGEDGTTNIITGVVVIVVAVVNALNAKKDLEYSKKVLTSPAGIVAKYKPVNELVITLVYNLVLGGLVGVVGSVFGFLTRKYVLDNEPAFLALENAQVQQPQQ